jgi:hypothetical protein
MFFQIVLGVMALGSFFTAIRQATNRTDVYEYNSYTEAERLWVSERRSMFGNSAIGFFILSFAIAAVMVALVFL